MLCLTKKKTLGLNPRDELVDVYIGVDASNSNSDYCNICYILNNTKGSYVRFYTNTSGSTEYYKVGAKVISELPIYFYDEEV